MTGAGPATAILIVRLRNCRPGPRDAWSDGPVPLPLPRDGVGASAYVYRPFTDRSTRSEYMRDRVNTVLYGKPNDGRRQHQASTGRSIRGCSITWLETMQMPLEGSEAESLLAIHLACGDLGGDDLAALTADLGNLREIEAGVRPEVERLIQSELPGAELANSRIGYVVTHWVPDSLPPSPLPDISPEVAWPRLIAAANPAARSSSQVAAATGPFDVDLSQSWRAAVMRAGASFVALSGPSDSFHPMAGVLVHSVYLDAVLLVLCQDHGIDELSSGLGQVWDEESTLSDISVLERRARRFRGQVWWTEISATSHVNRVLGAMQEQRQLENTEQRLSDDIDGLVSYASARRSDRTNRLLTVFTVAGIALGGAALIAEPGSWAMGWGVLLALLGVALVLAVEARSKRW